MINTPVSASLLLIALLLLLGGPVRAETPPLPREAYGPVDMVLPPGATRIEPQAYERLRQERRLVPVSPELTREGFEQAAAQRAALQRKLQTQLRGHDNVLQRLMRKPQVDGRRLRERSDGTYLLQLPSRQTVVLENELFLAREVSDALEALSNPAVRATTYDQLRTRVATTVRNSRQRQALLADLPVRSRDVRDTRQLEEAMTILIARYVQWSDAQTESEPAPPTLPGPPSGFPASCSEEEGSGVGSDRLGSACNPRDLGLFRNADWPLKYRTTCVKNQGNRGTCVAFAITGAVEAIVARDLSRWINLSEQHLYYHEKNQWFTVPPNFGDGLNTPLSIAGQMLGGFRYAFESAWDYNPSPQRQEVINHPFEYGYTNSCNGYNGTHCSDTNHQGKQVCTQTCVGMSPFRQCWTTCSYTSEVTGNASFRITGINPFFNVLNPTAGANTARIYLESGTPVVASLQVVDSFDNVDGNGYVSFVPGNEGTRGGHAVLLTGYVPNSQVPAGAPEGAGGGYFVAKNSWGCGAGDAGYYYLPMSWVIKNVSSMMAVTGFSAN